MSKKRTIFIRILGLITAFFMISGVSIAQHASVMNVGGDGTTDGVAEGEDALMSGFGIPGAIASDSEGNIYFGVAFDTGAGTGLYKIDKETNLIETIVPNAVRVSGIAVGDDGRVYFSFGVFDGQPYSPEYIYYVDPATPDVIDTLAGVGFNGVPVDGANARTTPIGNAGGLKIRDGFLYYSANLNGLSPDETFIFYYNFIQKIDLTTGETTRVIGGHDEGVTEPVIGDITDGTPIADARMNLDVGLDWDTDGNLYFGTTDRKIKMIDYDLGQVFHVAGNGEDDYDASETVAATAAIGRVNSGFIINDQDELYLCDYLNNYIRKINLVSGSTTVGETIETVIGTGFEDGEGDASNDLANDEFLSPLSTNINPRDLINTNDGLYFTDEDAKRIRRAFICENPTATDAEIDREIICTGDSVTMSFTGDLNDAVVWYWYEDACGENKIEGANGTSLQVVVDESKTYYARGEGGCSNVTECLEFSLDVSCVDYFNTFTPNNDGKNDFFEIPLLDSYETNRVTLYNRWGQVLETIDNYDNETTVWYGTNGNNDPVDSGTYYFTAEANGEVLLSGWVQVIK